MHDVTSCGWLWGAYRKAILCNWWSSHPPQFSRAVKLGRVVTPKLVSSWRYSRIKSLHHSPRSHHPRPKSPKKPPFSQSVHSFPPTNSQNTMKLSKSKQSTGEKNLPFSPSTLSLFLGWEATNYVLDNHRGARNYHARLINHISKQNEGFHHGRRWLRWDNKNYDTTFFLAICRPTGYTRIIAPLQRSLHYIAISRVEEYTHIPTWVFYHWVGP